MPPGCSCRRRLRPSTRATPPARSSTSMKNLESGMAVERMQERRQPLLPIQDQFLDVVERRIHVAEPPSVSNWGDGAESRIRIHPHRPAAQDRVDVPDGLRRRPHEAPLEVGNRHSPVPRTLDPLVHRPTVVTHFVLLAPSDPVLPCVRAALRREASDHHPHVLADHGPT